MLKWAIELSEYGIKYQPQFSLKEQVMTDFVAELPKKQTHSTDRPGEQWWTLHVDGASKVSRFRIGLVLQSPNRELIEQAICLNFLASNNEAEYEVVLVRLDLALMLATTKLQIRNDSQLIIEQIQREYETNDECMVRYLAMVEERLKN